MGLLDMIFFSILVSFATWFSGSLDILQKTVYLEFSFFFFIIFFIHNIIQSTSNSEFPMLRFQNITLCAHSGCMCYCRISSRASLVGLPFLFLTAVFVINPKFFHVSTSCIHTPNQHFQLVSLIQTFVYFISWYGSTCMSYFIS